MRDLLSRSLKTAAFDGKAWSDRGPGPGSPEGQYVDWLTIKDQSQSVLADVSRIRRHPLVPADIPVHGYVYDVKTGRLLEVPEATAVGKAR
jgi:carbonic anhydrase